MITPAPRLDARQNLNSVCGYYSSAGILKSITCGSGIECFTETTSTPAIPYCSGVNVQVACYAGTALPTTACKPDQLCCPDGQFCQEYNYNSGRAVNYVCGTTPLVIAAFLKTTSQSSPSSTTPPSLSQSTTNLFPSSTPSSSSDSSAGDTALGIVFIVIGVLFTVGLIFGLWWFCCRRGSWFRTRRARKYNRLGTPAVVGGNPINLGHNPSVDGASASLISRPGPPVPYTSADSLNNPPIQLEALGKETSDSPHNAQWPELDARNKVLTYKVAYIPASTTWDRVKDLFQFPDSQRITVKSLAPAYDGVGKVATIEFKSFRGIEPTLKESRTQKASIDKKFYGWTPLNDPLPPIEADVVAVTGLAGHAFGSWAHSPKEMWLRDYLVSDIEHIRVMTYGYNSQLQDQGARQNFDWHAEDFAGRLRTLWHLTNNRRTILIGHSLGCLLIKQALIKSATWPQRPPLKDIVPQIIFFGAPNRGLATNALMTLVKGSSAETLIKDLKPGSEVLREMNWRFAQVARDVKVLTIFETQPTPTAIEKNGKWVREGEPVMMVEPENALANLDNEQIKSAQADHKHLAKLEHKDIYDVVLTAISSCLRLPARQLSRRIFNTSPVELPTSAAQQRHELAAIDYETERLRALYGTEGQEWR